MRRARNRTREDTLTLACTSRENILRQWLDAVGFNGVYEHNAADFIAHRLGYSRQFVVAVLGCRDHFGAKTAILMRREKAAKGSIADFDYRLLTEEIFDLLKIKKPKRTEQMVKTVKKRGTAKGGKNSTSLPPGHDGQGRPQILIILCDGTQKLVTLPAGVVIDGGPRVHEGSGGDTGSVSLLFIRKQEPAS